MHIVYLSNEVEAPPKPTPEQQTSKKARSSVQPRTTSIHPLEDGTSEDGTGGRGRGGEGRVWQELDTPRDRSTHQPGRGEKRARAERKGKDEYLHLEEGEGKGKT